VPIYLKRVNGFMKSSVGTDDEIKVELYPSWIEPRLAHLLVFYHVPDIHIVKYSEKQLGRKILKVSRHGCY